MPAEDRAIAQNPPAKPRVWPVFLGCLVVFVAANLVSVVVLGIGVGREVLSGDIEKEHLNGEVLSGLLQELSRQPALACIIFALTSFVFIGYALAAGWMARESLERRLRLRRTTLPAVLFATAGLFALSELLDTLVATQNWFRYSQSLKQIQSVLWQMDGQWLPAAIILFGVFPGLGEELFFRGFVQSRLSTRWGSGAAVVISAVLFGLAHSDPVHSPLAFVMGLALGVAVEWTGSVWPAIIAHMVNNSLSVLGTLGYVQFNLPLPWKVGALAVLATSAFLLLRPESAELNGDLRSGEQATDWS